MHSTDIEQESFAASKFVENLVNKIQEYTNNITD